MPTALEQVLSKAEKIVIINMCGQACVCWRDGRVV